MPPPPPGPSPPPPPTAEPLEEEEEETPAPMVVFSHSVLAQEVAAISMLSAARIENAARRI
jgi:hypothetical protein